MKSHDRVAVKRKRTIDGVAGWPPLLLEVPLLNVPGKLGVSTHGGQTAELATLERGGQVVEHAQSEHLIGHKVDDLPGPLHARRPLDGGEEAVHQSVQPSADIAVVIRAACPTEVVLGQANG